MKNRDKIEEMAQKLVIANLTPHYNKGRISEIYENTMKDVVKRSIQVSVDFYGELDTCMSVKPEPNKTK